MCLEDSIPVSRMQHSCYQSHFETLLVLYFLFYLTNHTTSKVYSIYSSLWLILAFYKRDQNSILHTLRLSHHLRTTKHYPFCFWNYLTKTDKDISEQLLKSLPLLKLIQIFSNSVNCFCKKISKNYCMESNLKLLKDFNSLNFWQKEKIATP